MSRIKRFFPHTFPNGAHHLYGKTSEVFTYDSTPQCVVTQGWYSGYEPINPQMKVTSRQVWQPNKIIKDLMLSDNFLQVHIKTSHDIEARATFLAIFYGLTFARRVALDDPMLYKEIHNMHFSEKGWSAFMAWRFRTKVLDAQPSVDLT